MDIRAGWIRAVIAAASLLAGAVPASAAEADFTVVAATKEASHPHHGEGSPVGFVVNGVQGRTLVLVRGKTYRFAIDTGVMHDFYLSSDPRGAGMGTVTKGVTGNFTYKGTLTFTPSAETPDLIYYACRNHKFMGGMIHVVNPGEEGKVKVDAPPVAAAAQKARPALDRNEIKQRLAFVEMYVNTSESAKRVAASDNAEAKARQKDAQDRLAQAKRAFEGDNLEESKTRFDEAMALMKDAVKLVPSGEAVAKAKARYAEQVQSVAQLQASYRKNRDAILAEGGKPAATLDEPRLGRMLESARSLADQGKYDDACHIVGAVMNDMSNAVNALLANRTISYDVKFASPAEEYEYELARYISHEELIPLAKERMPPSADASATADRHLASGKAKREQAASDARRKDYAAALENIRAGSEEIKAALGALGVR